jgi:zinc transport system substrate-binding protein
LQEFALRIAGDRGDVELLASGAGPNRQPRPVTSCGWLKPTSSWPSGRGWSHGWQGSFGVSLPPGQVIELARVAALAAEGREDDEPQAGNEHHGGDDPHLWLDFELAARVADRIALALAEADPPGRDVFRARAQALKAELGSLDEEFRTGLAGCAGRSLLVAGHAAFGYLARRYGLKQVALYGPSPEAQPRPRAVVEVVELARRQGVQAVFYETSVAPDLARAIAREIGARTLVLNAGHNPTRAELMQGRGFFDIMRKNLERLRDGLGCR